MPINSDSISVVVQGAVIGNSSQPYLQQFTKRALQSVRQFLPDAELILSTWEGSEIADLTYDVLVLNRDPGAVIYKDGISSCNNVNRQIVSTKNGVERAARKYVLKLRSDTVLKGTRFLKYFGRYQARSPGTILKEKVIVGTRFSLIPNYKYPLSCYFVSDWFYFGLRDDVLNIWDIPLAPEPETTLWITEPPKPCHHSGPRLRYAIEQYIWVTFLRKHFDVQFESMWDQTSQTVLDSETSIAGNVVLISPEQAQIRPLKYPDHWNFFKYCQEGCYTHSLWHLLYDRHCQRKAFSCYTLAQWIYDALYHSLRIFRILRKMLRRLFSSYSSR